MSKLSNLEKLIKLNGDEQKYSEGLQILNSGISGNSGRGISLLIGLTLVTVAIGFNPSLQARFKDFLSTFKVAESEATNKPPLPPEIKEVPPLPPSPLPSTGAYYQSVPQGESLVYRP